MAYIRITLDGGGSYVQPMDDVLEALDAELDVLPVGDKLTIEIIEMSDDEYRRLPEFRGH